MKLQKHQNTQLWKCPFPTINGFSAICPVLIPEIYHFWDACQAIITRAVPQQHWTRDVIKENIELLGPCNCNTASYYLSVALKLLIQFMESIPRSWCFCSSWKPGFSVSEANKWYQRVQATKKLAILFITFMREILLPQPQHLTDISNLKAAAIGI